MQKSKACFGFQSKQSTFGRGLKIGEILFSIAKSSFSFDTEGKLSLYYSLFAVGLCSKFLQYLNPCHASPLADSSECMVLRKQAQNFKNILNHFHL